MEFRQTLETRHSVRAFSDRPVDDQLLTSLLEQSLASPSWSNTQPYQLAVATGAVLDDLRRSLSERFARANALQKAPIWQKLAGVVRGGVMPDGDFKPVLKYPRDLQPRRVATGLGLYQALGIEREDRAGRDEQMARNFRFFDAPVAVFVFVHDGLGVYSALDAGIFLQSLMLSATDAGLGTCAQGALALWRSPLEKHFSIPAHYKLLCGVSLGYALDDAPVNQFRPGRQPLQNLLIAPQS